MNELFRAARLRTPSPVCPDVPMSRRELAILLDQWVFDRDGRQTGADAVYIGKLERGDIRWPKEEYRSGLRDLLHVASDFDLGFHPPHPAEPLLVGPAAVIGPTSGTADSDGIEAIELLRRVEASDVGPATLDAISAVVDRLAESYAHVAPSTMLPSLRTHQGYVGGLLDGRCTLKQRKALMRHAGWLSLLMATAHLDVGNSHAAATNLDAAHGLASELDDGSLVAWTFETRAWGALSNGELQLASALCRAGLDAATRDTPAHVQLCTQTARVAARLGDSDRTYEMVDECLSALDRTTSGATPGGHFECDARRALLHCAAALVWLDADDSAAEEYARRALAQYEHGPWVHHLAVARVNLALLLAANGEPGEAARLGSLAFDSAWRLCSTDLFLLNDLDERLGSRYSNQPAVSSFHDRCLAMRSEIETRAIGSGDDA